MFLLFLLRGCVQNVPDCLYGLAVYPTVRAAAHSVRIHLHTAEFAHDSRSSLVTIGDNDIPDDYFRSLRNRLAFAFWRKFRAIEGPHTAIGSGYRRIPSTELPRFCVQYPL